MTEKKGILVVSFGTVYAGTRQLTIDAIRNTIQEAHPECAVYEAWTSRRIIRKLLETTGERIRTVGEALEEMERDGIREVYIQPTHVIDGIENERMKEEAGAYEDGISEDGIRSAADCFRERHGGNGTDHSGGTFRSAPG